MVQSCLSVNTVTWWTLEPMNVDEEASWILIQQRFLTLLSSVPLVASEIGISNST